MACTAVLALVCGATLLVSDGFPGHVARVGAGVDGGITRGKTANHRLRALDTFVALYDWSLFTVSTDEPSAPLFVDVGFGDSPTTTLQSAGLFRHQMNRQLVVCGIEYDRDRAVRANEAVPPHEKKTTRFVQGGFDVPMDARPAHLIRTMNVLRQYEPDAVESAHAKLGGALIDGGMLIEGTSDDFGRRCVVHVLRRHRINRVAGAAGEHAGVPRSVQLSRAASAAAEAAVARTKQAASADSRFGPIVAAGNGWVLEQEALVFYVAQSARRGGALFDPLQLRAVLPKAYIHRAVPGEAIDAFLELWHAAHANAAGCLGHSNPRAAFLKGVQLLASRVPAVYASPRLVRRGFVVWRQAPYSSGEEIPAVHGALAAAMELAADHSRSNRACAFSTLLHTADATS